MPLARITAPLPEYYERLAQDLRARGFDIETSTPGQFFSSPADLEIVVKHCTPEAAARLAAATEKDMCVVLSPKTKTGGVRSIEMIVVQPKAEDTEGARHRVTPGQVIEISSALVANPVVVDDSGDADKIQEKAIHWPKVKAATHSNWVEISKTTGRWVDSLQSLSGAGWVKVKLIFPALKAFFAEVGQETRELGSRVSAVLSRSLDHQKTSEEEQLVPSMFDLGAEDSFPDAVETVATPVEITVRKVKTHPRDLRYLKVSAVAALVAALAVLTLAMVRHPRPAIPSATAVPASPEAAVTPLPLSNPAVSASAPTQKPTAAVHPVSARRVTHTDGAEDTVVRFGNHTRPAQNESHSQIKRYSDLD